MRILKFLHLLAAFYLSITLTSASGGSVVVLANSIDGPLASGLYDQLEAGGMTVVKADANSFDSYKEHPLIIVLGGQNAPEGVGFYASQALSQPEKDYIISSNSSSGAFTTAGVWGQQTIITFAGYDEQQTKSAWERNRQLLLDLINTQNQNIRVEITKVSDCTSAKFNEILLTIHASNTSQAAWETNNPEEYISLSCNESAVSNFMLFERKVGDNRYGRNDLMHKTIDGDYRLKVACDREVSSWIPDVTDCGEITVNVTLPQESGYGSVNPTQLKKELSSIKTATNAFISSPEEGDNVTVWSNGVGFIVNVTSNDTADLEDLKLNALTASGRHLETNYPKFNLKAGQTIGVLIRVNAQQVVENDSIAMWLDGSANVTVKVDRRIKETVPLYCSFCAKH